MPYRNPFRHIRGLQPERIDQGVDYGGVGPVYALGAGVITNVHNAGWPGGTFIAEKLTEGPFAGRYVYEAETSNPRVHVGQHVTSNTITSYMTGPSSIEIGWAVPPGRGLSMASAHGQVTHGTGAGETTTAYGKSMSQLLHKLGAPAGQQVGKTQGTVPGSFQGGIQTTSAMGGGGGILPNLNPVPYLLSNLGIDNFPDMLQRGGLIILGAILLLVGLWRLTKDTQAGQQVQKQAGNVTGNVQGAKKEGFNTANSTAKQTEAGTAAKASKAAKAARVAEVAAVA